MKAKDKVVLETLAESLDAMDLRLAAIETRFVTLEGHLADGAHAADEGSKSLQKLQDLYVAIDDKLEQLNAMLGNYVQETQALRRTSRDLISEVRQKLKEAPGG